MINTLKIEIGKEATIKEAILAINNGNMQIALVVDKDRKLLGTVTDGDIRRGFLQGFDINSNIKGIFFKTPTVATLADSKEDILKKALKKKIHQIPIVDKNFKVIGIKEIEELVKPKQKSNKVILMVGGLGTRLKPFTDNIPKPMLLVGNKPILHSIVEKFAEYGYINIIMCVNYKSHIIQNYFDDGSKFGVNIEYILEEKRMGTAGALSLLKEIPNEPFFAMNGDLLTNMNFENMMDFHIENNSVATMGVKGYDFQVPYGVVNIEGINIKTIDEKPIHNFFVSAGIYVLNSSALNIIPDNEFYDMPTLFEKLIINERKCISFPIREYWLDIGRKEDYEKANNEYQEFFNV
jgi:dTDP-glucose pyrophosphorylase